MNTKQFGLFFVGVLAFVLVMGAVSALTIYSDSFNNLSGWTVTGAPCGVGGTAWTNTGSLAEAKPGAISVLGTSVIEKTISTSGFQSIVVAYDRQLVGFGAEEEFNRAWSTDGTNYNILEETLTTTPNDVAMVPKTFNIPVSAADNTGFRNKELHVLLMHRQTCVNLIIFFSFWNLKHTIRNNCMLNNWKHR